MTGRVVSDTTRPAGAAPGAGTARRPRPGLTQDNRPFFEAAREGRLVLQRCDACDRFQHPPSPRCPVCGSYGLTWADSTGRGEVYAFVVNHHPQLPAFDYPLVVALVALEEGVRLVSNIVGVDHSEVRIGMPVTACFEAVDDELTLPMFRPRGGSGEVRRDVSASATSVRSSDAEGGLD